MDRASGKFTRESIGEKFAAWLTSRKDYFLERASIGLRSMASWWNRKLRWALLSARLGEWKSDGFKLFSRKGKKVSIVAKLDFTRWTVGFTWMDLRDILPGDGTWWLFIYPFPCVAVMIGF